MINLHLKQHPRLEDVPLDKMRKVIKSASHEGSHKLTAECVKELKEVHDNIIKADNDDRLYRSCSLVNRLKVLLISDPTADQAAAALHVNHGYKHDYIQGFAHLFQHVLYASRPNNKFSKYIKKNSGIVDSRTSDEFTTYYFDVKATVFEQALQKFVQLFKELPDLTDEDLEEIITKMHKEDRELRETANYRLSRLFKWNIDPSHDMSKSRCGTLYTIYEKPKETRPSLKEYVKLFYPVEYGADNMSLCVMGKESIDKLHVMVLRLFSSLPRKQVQCNVLWYPPPCEYVQKIWCRDIPVDESRLYLIYPLENIASYHRMMAMRYLVYVFTYRGKKTFASVLESKGWITCIEAGDYPCGTYYSFMNIGIKLTEEGLKHVDDIIALFFQYNKLLMEKGKERWMYNEFKEIQELKFRFEKKQPIMNYVWDVARKVYVCSRHIQDTVLRNGFVPFVWSKFFFDFILFSFLDPLPQMRIFIIDKSIEGYVKENELINIEPDCSLKYKTEIISREVCAKWMNARPELELPISNKFIPKTASWKPYEERIIPNKYPMILLDTPFMRVWFKRCPEYNIPKIDTILHFMCPYVFAKSSTANAHFNIIFVRLVKESLRDYEYAAALVDTKWEIDATTHGIQVKINGFDDKQYIILEKILDLMLNFKLDAETFEVARQYNKKFSINQLEKFEKDQPYNQAHEYLVHLLTDNPMRNEVLKEYTHVTFEALEEFISNLFSTIFVECLTHGNINKLECMQIGYLIEAKLRARRVLPLKTKFHIEERQIKMEKNHHFVFQACNKHHLGSCTKIFYQIPKGSIKMDMLTQFIQHIIAQRFCDLISYNKLGYYAHCGVLITKSVQGLTFLVHGSHKHVHLKISRKIDLFVFTMMHYILRLTVQDFKKKKDEFMSYYFKSQTMNELSEQLWNEITNENYEYLRTKLELECIQDVSQLDIYEFYHKYINKNTPKLSVHITSVCNKENEDSLKDNITVIDNIEMFKTICSLDEATTKY